MLASFRHKSATSELTDDAQECSPILCTPPPPRMRLSPNSWVQAASPHDCLKVQHRGQQTADILFSLEVQETRDVIVTAQTRLQVSHCAPSRTAPPCPGAPTSHPHLSQDGLPASYFSGWSNPGNSHSSQ